MFLTKNPSSKKEARILFLGIHKNNLILKDYLISFIIPPHVSISEP